MCWGESSLLIYRNSFSFFSAFPCLVFFFPIFVFSLGFRFRRWDPKKRMTPDEACHHEWLQPSANSSYNHNKVIRGRQDATPDGMHQHQSQQQQQQQQQSQQIHQQVSPKTQKYFTPTAIATTRQLHQTQHIILPEVRTPSKYSNYKLYKDRTKGNWIQFQFFKPQHNCAWHRHHHYQHHHHHQQPNSWNNEKLIIMYCKYWVPPFTNRKSTTSCTEC